MPGFVQYAKPIDLNKIRLDVEERITSLKFNYQVYQELLPVLKKWDGKKITKRLQDAIARETGYKVRLDQRIIRQRYLEIENEKSGQKCRTFIGYDDVFDYERYTEEHSKADQNCKPVYEKLERARNKLPQFVNKYNELLTASQKLVECACEVGMDYDFDILAKER
jgi:hypothetical protein